jgi:hypothetical protein
MTPAMGRSRFLLHGLPVSVETDDVSLAAFVRAHFEADEGNDPSAELRVRASWRWGEEPAVASLPAGWPAQKAGRGLTLACGDRADAAAHAVWTRVPGFPELTLHYALSGETSPQLEVEASCAYTPQGLGRRLEYLRPARVERKRDRLFFKLMYFAVYYPMAWCLQRGRGWGLVHASAVALPSGRAVLLAGMGGVGKSTLGLSLLSRPGARLLSDNLLFHDAHHLYSCPEPVRLDDLAVKGIAGTGLEPERSGLPLTAHPKPTYALPAGLRVDAAPPAAVFFLRAAAAPSCEPIDAARAAVLLAAGNDLAREIEDLRPCAALLDTLAATRGRPRPVAPASLDRLLEGVPCALFSRGEGESVARTAARLAEAVEKVA